jgi:hypothetical protein
MPFQLAAQDDIEPPLPVLAIAAAGVVAGVAAAAVPPDFDMQLDMKALCVVAFLAASLMPVHVAEHVFMVLCWAPCAALAAIAGLAANAASITVVASIARMNAPLCLRIRGPSVLPETRGSQGSRRPAAKILQELHMSRCGTADRPQRLGL